MIKKITKKVMKEVEETVSEIGICDVCGKEFVYDNRRKAIYYCITTGHYDWGNDSIDSIEHHDACCDECLAMFTRDWLNDDDVINSSTAYIHIDKESHFKEK